MDALGGRERAKINTADLDALFKLLQMFSFSELMKKSYFYLFRRESGCVSKLKKPHKQFLSTQEVSQCLTCQVFQAELAKAGVPITSVIEEDGEGVAIFIQFCSTDDPQVLQRQVVKLVQGHQHIASHFMDRLWRDGKGGRLFFKLF